VINHYVEEGVITKYTEGVIDTNLHFIYQVNNGK
jgi:hypothetical protein